ncbi:MAG: MFS transporter [Pseudomonadota bacterium]|jgi:sugar phosphate permease|nr:MFS transporter [Gammaproteobacteria bacterium]
MSIPRNPPPAALAWSVWGLGAGLFLLGFFHRVAPAVLHRELSVDFGLNATSLGSLSALYFYSYVAMQIPTGLIADRVGPRRLLIGGIIISTLGAILFALAPSLFWAGLGRFLIGGSVAVGFVCTLKLATHWLPTEKFSLAAGLLLVAGMMGAVFAGVPLHLASDAVGWRVVTLVVSAIGLFLALVVWFIVRDDPAEKGFAPYVEQDRSTSRRASELQNLKSVFAYRNTWFLALAPGGIVGSVLAFSGLWGMPFLTDVYQLPAKIAAMLCSGIMLSWAFSGPLFGLFSEKLKNRRILYLSGALLALGCWSVVILIPELPLGVLVVSLLGAGFFSGGMILGFTQAKESVPISLSGTVSGVVNMGVMCGPMILQPLIGWLLDRLWQGGFDASGLRTYGYESYRLGFSLMLIWLIISVISISLSKETHGRQFSERYDTGLNKLN